MISNQMSMFGGRAATTIVVKERYQSNELRAEESMLVGEHLQLL
jgi:hypothetical protein